MRIEFNSARSASWVALGIFAAALLGGAGWLIAGSGPPVLTDAATGVAGPRQLGQGAAVVGKTLRVCNGTSATTGTGTGDRMCFSDSEGDLPSGSPGQVAGIRTVTVSATTTGTASATAVGTMWDSVNGTIYAGTNIRLTKGTDTETDTAVTMADKPTVQLYGFSGTTDVLPKKTATGWGDSPLSHDTYGGVESGSSFRVSSFGFYEGGAGLLLSYAGESSIDSYNQDTASYENLFISGAAVGIYGSSVSTYVNNVRTWSAPPSDGDAGQCLATNGSGTTYWGPCGSGAEDSYTVRPYSGQSPGFLENVILSSDGSVTVSEYAGKLNLRTTAHASTHKGGGSDAIDVATQSVNGLMSSSDKLKLDHTSATPIADYIPVANGSGKLTAWIDAATQSIPGTMSAADKTKLDNSSATPTASYIVIAKNTAKIDDGWINTTQTPAASRIPYADNSGTLNHWTGSGSFQACLSSDDTATTSYVLNAVYFGGFTQAAITKHATNGIRVTYHLSGLAGASGATVVAKVMYQPAAYPRCLSTITSVGANAAANLSASCVFWDTQWVSGTPPFSLQVSVSSGTFTIPALTNQNYSACMQVDEVRADNDWSW